MKTHVAYTVNQNDVRHPGARAVEPAADDAYAVRGKLYIAIELFPLALTDDVSGDGSSDVSRANSGYSGANFAKVNNQLLSVVQQTYYATKGSHAQVISAALSQAQQTLHQINSQQPEAPFGAGLGSAALLGNRIVIATAGPIISLIASDKSIQQFPSEISTALTGTSDQPDPDIQIYQRSIENGGAFFLGSAAWLNHVEPRELLGMMAHLTDENSNSAAQHISQQSRFATIPGLFLTVQQSGQSPSAAPQPPTTQTSRAVGGLPTSVHATTHKDLSPSTPQAYVDQRTPSAPSTQARPEQSAPSAPQQPRQPEVLQAEHAQAPHSTVPHSTQRNAVEYEYDYEEDDLLDDEYAVKQTVKTRPSILGQIGATFDRILKPSDAPNQERSSTRERVPYASESRADDRSASARDPMMSESEYRSAKGWSSEAVAEPLYIEPKPASGGRARLFLTLAALILVLVPLIVFASVLSQGVSSRAQAESMIGAAEEKIRFAETALDSGDNGSARVELQEAQNFLDEADNLKGDRNRISLLKARVQQNFQSVLQVVPFYMLVEPLVRFPADASPSRVMVVHQNIYILDRGRNQIIRYRMSPNGETVPDDRGEVVLQQGDTIDGFQVGPLIDMAWQTPSVGNEEKSNLIVLDSNNQVFRYNQVVDGPSRIEFGNQALWQSPTQIQSYLGRFYIADSGRGQIYRYAPGNFGGEPEEWLSSPATQSLSSLLSMVIDGDIWMLFSSGQLVRYHNGLTVPFALDNDVGVTEPVDMFIGEQEDSLIYLADAGADRILVFQKDGAYLRQHQAAEGTPLRDLRGIFVDEITRKIYLLTQSSLYQHPLSE